MYEYLYRYCSSDKRSLYSDKEEEKVKELIKVVIEQKLEKGTRTSGLVTRFEYERIPRRIRTSKSIKDNF